MQLFSKHYKNYISSKEARVNEGGKERGKEQTTVRTKQNKPRNLHCINKSGSKVKNCASEPILNLTRQHGAKNAHYQHRYTVCTIFNSVYDNVAHLWEAAVACVERSFRESSPHAHDGHIWRGLHAYRRGKFNHVFKRGSSGRKFNNLVRINIAWINKILY